MITLYDYELSGNCYKLRLFMSFLHIPYKTVPIDFYPGREHKSEWFLKINPLGQLPVIDDDGYVLRDAQAILAYLAARYDLAPELLERMQARGVLYDRAKDGEFFHIYTRAFEDRFFFEIVERHNYDLFGAANTPIRLAAQASLTDNEKRAEAEFTARERTP